MNECPCRYCDKRHATCHSECEDYKSWSSENEEIRKMVNKKKYEAFLDSNNRKRRHRK